MYQQNNEPVYEGYTQAQSFQVTDEMIAGHVSKVMGWMFVGLLTTFVFAVISIKFPIILYFSSFTPIGYWGIFIAQLAMVFALNFAVSRAKGGLATFLYVAYSALTGVTLSVFYLVYRLDSLLLTFLVTAGIFLIMAIVGYNTQKDVTRFRTVFMFALVGLVLSSLINMILGNSLLQLVISGIGILVFMGLIVFDMQKIKQNYTTACYQQHTDQSDVVHSLAILGAMQLYLDVINIFLYLLRFLGKRKN